MPIKRCSEQKSMTLEEFYADLLDVPENSKFFADLSTGMLGLIHLINELFKDTQICGLTSLARLILLNVDDSRSNWFVTIGCVGQEYFFSYLMPVDKAPWKNATITGEVNTIEEAKKYLLIAMRESGGWADNEELKQLMLSI